MHITYAKYDFTLKFDSPILFDVYPLFVIRSVLGDKLRSICCRAKGKNCPECVFNKTCPYSWIFETILDKSNEAVPGRDRGSHPYFLSFPSKKFDNFQEKVDKLTFTLTLMGKAIEYFPYIFEAIKKAGKSGLLKERIPYSIESVVAFDETLTDDEENLIKNATAKDFSMEIDSNKSQKTEEKSYLVKFTSPLRINAENHILNTITAYQFFMATVRRMRTLCSMYGEVSDSDFEKPLFNENSIYNENFVFIDLFRWSSRQKQSMKLGGIIGECKLSGSLSEMEEKLIEAASIFGIGKNNALGLGQVSVQKV